MGSDGQQGNVVSAEKGGMENAFFDQKSLQANHSWLIARLAGGCYALPVTLARTMVVCPKVTKIPNVPEFVRGVVNLRGQVMPVVDLRKYLGYRSQWEENEALCAQLDAREQDHKNWLSELESCVQEGRDFKLATDPHKCAFGKWYDSYKTDDLNFSLLLRKFKDPHERIHKIAEIAMEKHAAGDNEGALLVVNDTRNGDLATMLQLFMQTRDNIRKSVREIIIVLDRAEQRVAVTVDKLEAVESLDAKGIDDTAFRSMASAQQMVLAMGKRSSGELVMLLNVEQIFSVGDAVNDSAVNHGTDCDLPAEENCSCGCQ